MVINAKIGAHIRLQRRVAGLTQERLARKLGVDRTTVARWERGVAEPRPENIAALRKMGLLDRHTLVELLGGSVGLNAPQEHVITIVAPPALVNGGCRFGLLHIRYGTNRRSPSMNRPIDFVTVGDRGEMRATVKAKGNTGFEFKCFVDFGTHGYPSIAKTLEESGFAEVTMGEGKTRRAWFLLRGYRVVQERSTAIRNNMYFPE